MVPPGCGLDGYIAMSPNALRVWQYKIEDARGKCQASERALSGNASAMKQRADDNEARAEHAESIARWAFPMGIVLGGVIGAALTYGITRLPAK